MPAFAKRSVYRIETYWLSGLIPALRQIGATSVDAHYRA